jgi:hypothetical protein
LAWKRMEDIHRLDCSTLMWKIDRETLILVKKGFMVSEK